MKENRFTSKSKKQQSCKYCDAIVHCNKYYFEECFHKDFKLGKWIPLGKTGYLKSE